MEAYFNEKRKIFNGLNGKLPNVVINGDCPYGQRLISELPPQVRVLTFGIEKEMTLGHEILICGKGAEFILESSTGTRSN